MGDLRPNLILAAVVAVTALLGLGSGATWAFVGGLTANLLTTDPLGIIPLGLLLVAAGVAAAATFLGGRAIVLALAGGLVGSLFLDLLGMGVLLLQGGTVPPTSATTLAALFVPTAIVNGVLAVLVLLGGRVTLARFGTEAVSV